MTTLKELLQKYREPILYMVFGAVTTLVNLAVYFLCYNLWGIHNDISVILAWFFSILVAFLTNKPFVFESHDWSRAVLLPEAAGFFGCRAGSGVLELVLMHVTVEMMKLPGMLMKFLVNILVIIINYVGSKLLVFRKK